MVKINKKPVKVKDLIISAVTLFIIWIVVDAFVCNKKAPKPKEELAKIKVIKNDYRCWGGVYNSCVHRIRVKNNTGKDIDWLKLKMTYYDKNGNVLAEETESFSGTPKLNDFGDVNKKGVFKKGQVVTLSMGKWNRNAYKGDDTVNIGEQSAVYLGEDTEKVAKVKTEILDFEEPEKK